MKLPSRLVRIKPASLALAQVLSLAALASGCAPAMANAPFPARIDTVIPGTLVGPFDGRVLDGENGKPIAGALVYASWGFTRVDPFANPENGEEPAGAYELLRETDSDGRYTIPKLPEMPPWSHKVARFTLIVYMRGYVAFRSDRRFDDRLPRHDFAQRGTLVHLDHFTPQQSHAAHLAFIGGGPPLKRELEPERVLASLELSGEGAVKTAPAAPVDTQPIDASVLLSAAELKAVTGYDGELKSERLGDLPQSPIYDSIHFRAVDRPESYDAAIRAWKISQLTELDQRFEDAAKEIPGATTIVGTLGDRAVHGASGKILAVVTEDRARGVVIEIQCGTDQCRSLEQAVAILKRILPRTDRLVQTAPPSAAPSPTSTSPTP